MTEHPIRALDDDGDGRPDYAPTQVQHPWRATLRTVLAVTLGLGIVLPLAWAIIGDELTRAGLTLPPQVTATVAYVLALVAVVTGAITRIMAIPMVADLMTRWGLGPAPKG